MAKTAQLLMCAPRHFAVDYAINPWMAQALGQVEASRAQRQWRALKSVLSREAEVRELAPARDRPDLVFTANAGLVLGDVVVPARFRHAERQGEEALFARWFKSHGFRLAELPDGLCFEGAGDALFECETRRLWMGFGPRSEERAAPALHRLLGVDVEPLQLVDPRFYHLDTCFCPLPRGGLLWFPAAFEAGARLKIEAAFPADRRIAVVESEAARFACNAVVLGETVIGDGIGDATEARLAHLGFDVERVQLDEFQKSGGSAKCLTLRLDVPNGQGPARAARGSRVAAQSTSAQRPTSAQAPRHAPVSRSQSRTPSAATRPLAKQAVSR
jgi:N-dimethylarginine dimethylaminohydrolase